MNTIEQAAKRLEQLRRAGVDVEADIAPPSPSASGQGASAAATVHAAAPATQVPAGRAPQTAPVSPPADDRRSREVSVDPKSHRAIAALLPDCEVVAFPDSRHEIFMESDAYRVPWFAAIDDFIRARLPAPHAEE